MTAANRQSRLRRADTTGPGILRRRQGGGFAYVDSETGEPVEDTEVLQRVNELVIPPAWEDVWICPYPGGHIQATGVDAKGRKQYRYHERWRQRRDQEKFDEMLGFARSLPAMRERVAADLGRGGLPREKALAVAVRLLDKGFFRIGSEDYAVENETFGLATMKKRHVRLLPGDTLLFDYPAKHGKRRVQSVVDDDVYGVIRTMRARRGGGDELLAYKQGSEWRDIRSPDINEYLKDATGLDVSAKDFRTWNATVLAAVALSVSGLAAQTATRRKRAIVRAVKEVSEYLGNTPAVARASYIDPRVFDRFTDGITIDPAVTAAEDDEPAIQGKVEAAVIGLIEDPDPDSADDLDRTEELAELVA